MATVPPRTNTPADPNRLFGHEEANQPFHIKSAVYIGGTDTIEVTVGLGRADFGGGDVVEFAAEQTLEITPVAINTTYSVFLTSAGGLTYSSVSGVESAGQARLSDVATGATKDALTVTDRRGMFPVPTSSAELDDLADVDTAGASTGDVLTRKADGTYDLQAPAVPHIEAKVAAAASQVTVTWTTAFASTPVVTVGPNRAGFTSHLSTNIMSRSTTGAELRNEDNNSTTNVIATEAT